MHNKAAAPTGNATKKPIMRPVKDKSLQKISIYIIN